MMILDAAIDTHSMLNCDLKTVFIIQILSCNISDINNEINN